MLFNLLLAFFTPSVISVDSSHCCPYLHFAWSIFTALKHKGSISSIYISSFPASFLPLLSHLRSVDWGSVAGWWPPLGCGWYCSCPWDAGGRKRAEPSSACDAEHGASLTGPDTGQPGAAAAGNGSTAPEKSASGTSQPSGETLATVWHRSTHDLFPKQRFLLGELLIYSLDLMWATTFPGVSSCTWEAFFFSASCLKDKKAARGVHAGMSGPAMSSSLSFRDISSLSLLLPGGNKYMNFL